MYFLNIFLLVTGTIYVGAQATSSKLFSFVLLKFRNRFLYVCNHGNCLSMAKVTPAENFDEMLFRRI